jgi:ferredoxin-NADP reductase
MTIAAAPDVLSTYDSPGQYVEVCAENEMGFFVLANEPGAESWELVMRSGGGASDVLLAAGAGAMLDITAAIGAGFPMDDARGRPLLVVLGGSGIAAGPSIVGRRVTDGDAARTRVFVGIRTRAELPMRDHLEAWMHSGVDVLVCLSQDGGPVDGVPYAHGHVQDVLRTSTAAHTPPGSRIFAVGTASMIDALKSLAPELGLMPEHVHRNH